MTKFVEISSLVTEGLQTRDGLAKAVVKDYAETLKAGMKVLVLVHPDFHEAFGFSWIVDDIDPRFTLGDMARRRLEIIKILKERNYLYSAVASTSKGRKKVRFLKTNGLQN